MSPSIVHGLHDGGALLDTAGNGNLLNNAMSQVTPENTKHGVFALKDTASVVSVQVRKGKEINLKNILSSLFDFNRNC